jgi:glycosyltransferase involved in cell wall biosynthesis
MSGLSVVVPVRDEAENIPKLVARLTPVLEGISTEHEIIFATDLNRDNTLEVLRSLHRSDPRVKTLKLSNAFGHHIAVLAGLVVSRGESVVVMDGDLQDHPEDIPLLYAKLLEGHDVVYGVKERKNESALRNLFSRTIVRLMNGLSDYDVDFNTSMFRIMSRRAVDQLCRFRERDPSITGLVSIIGLPTTKVPVTSGTRHAGRTNYSYWRQFNFAINFVLSFSTKPLRLISMLGIGISVLALLYFFVVVIQRLAFGIPVPGWPTVVGLLSLLGGVQLLALGVTGEYVARIFLEVKRRPLYVVEEEIGELGKTAVEAWDTPTAT